MPSAEFARFCKDLSSIGDIVDISVTKEGVKFSTRGDIGTANIVCRQNTTVDKVHSYVVLKSLVDINEIIARGYVKEMGNVRVNGVELGLGWCEVIIQSLVNKDVTCETTPAL